MFAHGSIPPPLAGSRASFHLRSRASRASFGGQVGGRVHLRLGETRARSVDKSGSMTRTISTFIAVVLLTGCVARDATAPAGGTAGPRPVVIQGAMDVEIRKLASTIENAKEEKVQAWTFWTGTIDG